MDVILIMMVTATGTNPKLQSYFDYDDHWDQFGTTVDHAIEVQSDFHNDGHFDQFDIHT